MSTPDSPKPDPPGPTEPAVAFTPQKDEQILRGMVQDEAALLHDMSVRGHPEWAVRARAAHLGLTQQIVIRCRLAGSWPSMRECLACELRFLSMGSHHRLCKRCQPQR
jgi:hypothetical protein